MPFHVEKFDLFRAEKQPFDVVKLPISAPSTDFAYFSKKQVELSLRPLLKSPSATLGGLRLGTFKKSSIKIRRFAPPSKRREVPYTARLLAWEALAACCETRRVSADHKEKKWLLSASTSCCKP
jgi:hypothetical protein